MTSFCLTLLLPWRDPNPQKKEKREMDYQAQFNQGIVMIINSFGFSVQDVLDLKSHYEAILEEKQKSIDEVNRDNKDLEGEIARVEEDRSDLENILREQERELSELREFSNTLDEFKAVVVSTVKSEVKKTEETSPSTSRRARPIKEMQYTPFPSRGQRRHFEETPAPKGRQKMTPVPSSLEEDEFSDEKSQEIPEEPIFEGRTRQNVSSSSLMSKTDKIIKEIEKSLGPSQTRRRSRGGRET